ncbi:helical backbone metal receptor [Testudinibacter sp. TR-2022]|uniref:helical backbone metal receptor n=1 Tax=Testudinibacter sp. TR-2022 TaxID=2585029 RepID=UPI0011183ACF|nr:helical backbone metal receptor [Testudinibacter sp. TR-2022]TNH06099.1 helical backbone metal receptor [Pasteurellaceae bacterium Phil11]TNH23334.1 helical backbone metal receptor [Testudinibacter sp. TR-2022]TNH24502.1 helical backbone metal receptor [Testudinibacter sp. TR-2022]
MKKIIKILTALCLCAPIAHAEQFVSLTLCSDRLLIELARPEQIAAMSPYSTNPLMMLDKLNHDKPRLEPHLTALLPYLDKTVLLNEQFYPQLAAALKQLGVKIIPVNDSPQTPEQLFAFILQLGDITHNQAHAAQLVATLQAQNFNLNQTLTETLILSDTGVVESDLPQYQTLLKLLGLTPLKSHLSAQNFSLEQVVRSQPNFLIVLSDKQGYNTQAELLSHPLLQQLFQSRAQASAPLKYTYCFDHGVWQGAALLYQQLLYQQLNEKHE